MNRFENHQPHPLQKIISALPAIFLIIIFLVFIRGLSNVSRTTTEKQKASLETALSHSIAQCYAVEGQYPPSISYLVEHYGLIYDPDAFLIDYDSIGDNLYPEYTIVTRTGNHIFDY